MGIRDKINAAKAEQEQQAQADRQRLPQPSYASSNGTGPFDKLADLASWADILEPPNWNKVPAGDAATEEAWQHPDATHPISAKVLKANPHCLVVWSTNCGLPSGEDQKLTKGRVYAHLWHNGDESAAATAIIKGEAHHLPTHIQTALKGPDMPSGNFNVTEVTANQINGDNGGNQDRQDQGANQNKGRFTVRTFTDIQPRTSTWLLDGVLPDDDLTVFIGEEGIGKGLFTADVIARVTQAGHNVLIIATEDDFERVLRPRLDVAGADISRCFTMIADPDTLQGQPNLPHNRLEVQAVVNEYKVRLVYIDPWVSSVSGGLRLQNTQDARSAIDPLLSMARASHCSVLAVAHPNRGEGDLRARVGLSAVLRQAARLLLFAIEPPDDDTKLIIGIEKANEAGRAPASVYRKLPKKHPTLPKPVWAVEEITDAPRLTIRQWHDQYRTDRDHRRSDRWPSVLAAAKDSLVQRADIIAIYEESGSDQGAADKAINRWLKAGRLVKKGNGVYELPNE